MSTDRTRRLEGFADAGLPDRVLAALDVLWASNADTVEEEDRSLFTLAVSEIAANIVAHAEAREPVHVSVTLTVGSDDLEAVFTDTADPALIDLSAVKMPDWDAESGRGLAMSVAVLDELVHETHDGNTWRLRRHLRADG